MDSIKLIIKIYKEKYSLNGPYKIYIITLPYGIDFNKLFDSLLSKEGFVITDSFYDAFFVQNIYQQGAGGGAVDIILSIYQDIPIEEILSFITNKVEPTVFAIAGIRWLLAKAFSLGRKFFNKKAEAKQPTTLKYRIHHFTKREEILKQVSYYGLTKCTSYRVISKKEIKTLEEIVIAELEEDITD